LAAPPGHGADTAGRYFSAKPIINKITLIAEK
jgi:hypothetical protein